jgi:hypothetical protein
VKTVGLIAGRGSLPRIVAEDAKRQGYRVVVIALEPLADASFGHFADVVEKVNVGKLGKIFDALRHNGASEAVMAGKVSKGLMYKGGIKPDLRAVSLLMRLKDRSDDTIMLAITDELKKEGIKLLKTTDFCSDILVAEGVLTKTKPHKDEWKDIEFGFRMARELGRLDIGQTVVVKDMAVMAVEAIEGTDRAIKRGGKLAGDGAVVVKCAKPGQDLRFDVPAVGMDTVRTMMEVDARVLALEAGRTLFMDREKALAEADEAGIAVVGYKGQV